MLENIEQEIRRDGQVFMCNSLSAAIYSPVEDSDSEVGVLIDYTTPRQAFIDWLLPRVQFVSSPSFELDICLPAFKKALKESMVDEAVIELKFAKGNLVIKNGSQVERVIHKKAETPEILLLNRATGEEELTPISTIGWFTPEAINHFIKVNDEEEEATLKFLQVFPGPVVAQLITANYLLAAVGV